MYSLGYNSEGQLGLGHQHPSDCPSLINSFGGLKVISVHAGRHSAAITEEGKLFVWGSVFISKEQPLQVMTSPKELNTL